MSEASIKARVAARKAAEELAPLLEWEDGTGADYADAFLAKMRDLLPQRRVKTAPEKPTPYCRLAATVMPFGQHQGTPLSEVPDDYLDWLCRSQEEFLRDLRAYLKHPEHREAS